ncbi:MAG: hypothetical protein J6M27_04300 [Lachnospiraceae bacterium]|nr:hypothetical protein [Lachnospiraceae bacterium]
MGDIANKYKQILEEYQKYQNATTPDPATQTQEFLEFERNKRKANAKHNVIRSRILSHKYTNEEIFRAYGHSVGEEKAEESIRKYSEGIGLAYDIQELLSHKHPDLWQGLDFMTRRNFLGDHEKRKTLLDGWIRNGKIRQEELNDLLAKKLFFSFDNLPEDSDTGAFLDSLEQSLDPQEKQSILKEIEEYQDPYERDIKDPVTYPMKEYCDELKEQMPEKIKNDPEKKKEYEDALEYAAKHITETKPSVRDEHENLDKHASTVQVRKDKNTMQVLRPQYENGKYDKLTVEDDAVPGILTIAEDKTEAFDTARNGVLISDKTRDGLRKMFRKMEEMHLEEYGFDLRYEDGDKVYGLNKLMAQQKKLRDALKKEPPVPEDIIAEQKQYAKTVEDMQELYRIAKESFDQEMTQMPGNMDSWRDVDKPYEFTGDIVSTAQVNGVFLAYMQWKTQGLDLEEFLANPVKTLEDAFVDRYEKNSVEKKAESLSLEDTLELLSGSGRSETAREEYAGSVEEAEGRRLLQLPYLLEGDPEKKEQNRLFTGITLYEHLSDVISKSGENKFSYFARGKGEMKTAERAARQQTLQNLMLASDEDRKLSGMLSGIPQTDKYGRITGPGFDAEAYLQKTPVDYAGIMDRSGRIYQKIDAMKKDPANELAIDTADVLQARTQLYRNVLEAHPEDRNKPEYQQMQKAMNEGYDKLREIGSEEQREQTEASRQMAEERIRQSQRDYRIRYDVTACLSEMLEEAKRTNNYREFTDALLEAGKADYMLQNKAMEEGLTEEEEAFKEAYDQFTTDLFARQDNGVYIHGQETYDAVARELNRRNVEDNIHFSQQSEELAARIRKGEVQVEPVYQDMAKDYHASRILANRMLKGSAVEDQLSAERMLLTGIGNSSIKYTNGEEVFAHDTRVFHEEYIRKGGFGNTPAERRRYLMDGISGFTNTLAIEFGNGKSESDPGYDIRPSAVAKNLQESVDSTENYIQSLQEIKSAAAKKLKEMDADKKLGGRSGSDEYRAIYTALESIATLGNKNTPFEVENAIANVRYAAQNYQEKIDRQRFAGILSKGVSRYNTALDLAEMAGEWNNTMQAISHGRLDGNENLDDQMFRTIQIRDEYRKKLEAAEKQKEEAPQKETVTNTAAHTQFAVTHTDSISFIGSSAQEKATQPEGLLHTRSNEFDWRAPVQQTQPAEEKRQPETQAVQGSQSGWAINPNAESGFGGNFTFDQFKAVYGKMNLSEDAMHRIYMGMTDKEAEQAQTYASTGNTYYNPFLEWDAPHSRSAGRYPSILPTAVTLSGDANELHAYLDAHQAELNSADKAFVLKHIETIDKAAKIQKEQDEKLRTSGTRGNKPEIYTDEKGYERLRIEQPAAQSSYNGCWSVGLQQIIQSRGIEGVVQEDIRAFRPENYKGAAIEAGLQKGDYKYADEILNTDSGAIITETLDPVFHFAPNTMVRVLDIAHFDNPETKAANITEAQYAASAKEMVRQTVEKAIYIDHSPLVIKEEGRAHYLEIVGIKGDMLLIQDPLYVKGMMTQDRMREIPIDDFVSRITRTGTHEPLQIIWGSDLRLDKDGKLIGNPDDTVTVAQDGSVVLSAGHQKDNKNMIETMQNACMISRYGGRPAMADQKDVSPITAEGLVLTEQVYLPKKLNMAALTNEAKLRSAEEEQKLKTEAQLYYAPQSQLQGLSVKKIVEKGMSAAIAEAKAEPVPDAPKEEEKKQELPKQQASGKDPLQEAVSELKKTAKNLNGYSVSEIDMRNIGKAVADLKLAAGEGRTTREQEATFRAYRQKAMNAGKEDASVFVEKENGIINSCVAPLFEMRSNADYLHYRLRAEIPEKKRTGCWKELDDALMTVAELDATKTPGEITAAIGKLQQCTKEAVRNGKYTRLVGSVDRFAEGDATRLKINLLDQKISGIYKLNLKPDQPLAEQVRDTKAVNMMLAGRQYEEDVVEKVENSYEDIQSWAKEKLSSKEIRKLKASPEATDMKAALKRLSELDAGFVPMKTAEDLMKINVTAVRLKMDNLAQEAADQQKVVGSFIGLPDMTKDIRSNKEILSERRFCKVEELAVQHGQKESRSPEPQGKSEVKENRAENETGENRQRKKLEGDDLKNFLEGDRKESRRNPTRFKAEGENVKDKGKTEHGVNDVMSNNKAMVPSKP